MPNQPPFKEQNLIDVRLSPQDNARLIEHYFRSVVVSQECHQLLAVFGGKAPNQHIAPDIRLFSEDVTNAWYLPLDGQVLPAPYKPGAYTILNLISMPGSPLKWVPWPGCS